MLQPVLRLWGIRLIWLTVALTLVLLVSHIPGGLGSDGIPVFTSREGLLRSEYRAYVPPRTNVSEPIRMQPENLTLSRPKVQWSFDRYKSKARHYVYRLSRGEMFVMVMNRGQMSIVPLKTLVGDTWTKSLMLFMGALAAGTLLGVVLGCITAFSRLLRGLSLGLSIGGLSIPDFMLVQLGWMLTIWTYLHFGIRLWSVSGYGDRFPWLLPMLVLSIAPMGFTARLTTSALDEVMLQEYIRTARSKGLQNWTVVMGHAYRNALPQVLNGLPAMVQITLSSLIVVETICAYPGIGELLATAIDHDVTTTLAMLFCIWYVLMDGAAQTLRILVHPRLREVAE